MNYTQLVAAVKSYLQNDETDFNSLIPTFIQQAEQRIFNSIQFPSLRKNVIGAMTAGSPYLTCPDDFLSSHSLAIIPDATSRHMFLINKDVNFIREAYPGEADLGRPRHYAIFGACPPDFTELGFIIGPTPDLNYPVELHYYFYPPSIVTANTSWLGDNFDTVLLYGTLVEAYTHLKGEPDLVQLYDTKYKEALTLAKRLGDGLERQDSYRSGQLRIPII